MLRSMYSGISGMKNFQTKLDVIGNNIANVNTYGYKKGRVTFKDMVSQTISGASAPNGTSMGGTNPKQVGLGSQLSTIDTIDTQGSLQPTGRVLDLGIQGDGYFQVKKGNTTYYTRAGNFYFDNAGNLVTGSGEFVLDVQGNPITISNIDQVESLSIGQDGKISYVMNGNLTTKTDPIAVVRFMNNGGLEKVGDNLYKSTTNSGTPTPLSPGSKGAGTIVSGALEMSNVDLSEEFTEMITAQRGFQANTRIITTSDEILQELVNLKR
ncbi:flagellar basal body rod protein FlgG [Bacillus methanolicus]|uniref:flagellar basal body rod protein FlgG n=1 Tax=Bacillus methanolicus TaxID=1471 RepID=UPI00200D895D|nr:flagellar basal body rod protein FlgG [Bacillus methanolicus]UQD51712.1 flagellar basal body rod protein FlgG [Bacillus methanolicus]